MENKKEQKQTFIQKVKVAFKSFWAWIVPDRNEERIQRVNDSYKVVLKNEDLYLVFENEVVIKKLLPCDQNLDIIDIIEDTIHAQLEFEGLEVRP